jgi:hypothetical protein
LRKALKIKAYTILLAWGMIFAHSIIPHNHLDDCSSICCESDHQASKDVNDSEHTTIFISHPEDIRVCHVSGFLYHQFNQDNLISDTCEGISITPISLALRYSFSSSDSLITEHWNSSASFRAPPSA